MTAAFSPSSAIPDEHPPIRLGKIGVLLVNLGTPEGTDAKSVRRYLREFLSDKRVVDYPRWLWYPILYGIILNVRPAKTGRAYKKIWHEPTNESPLRYYTRVQQENLLPHFDSGMIKIDWAMRYGVPSLKEKMAKLKDQGCDRIMVLPLYPQYSATTTATVNDKVFDLLRGMSWQPAIRTAPPFHDHPLYIEGLTAQIPKGNFELVIQSFHGIPERYFKNGDPYHCHCQKTARLVREKMGWTAEFAPLAFQSKFGPETWLGPSTEDTIIAAAKAGKKHIAVMAPAFVSDCIETLEEVGIELAATFKEHGGETLTAIPCLNDSDEMTALLVDIIQRETAGWV